VRRSGIVTYVYDRDKFSIPLSQKFRTWIKTFNVTISNASVILIKVDKNQPLLEVSLLDRNYFYAEETFNVFGIIIANPFRNNDKITETITLQFHNYFVPEIDGGPQGSVNTPIIGLSNHIFGCLETISPNSSIEIYLYFPKPPFEISHIVTTSKKNWKLHAIIMKNYSPPVNIDITLY
jgi:hypothetical protein